MTQFKQTVSELQHATHQLGDAVAQLQHLVLDSTSTEARTYRHTTSNPITHPSQASVGAALRRYHDNQNLLARLVDHLAQYGYHDTTTKPPVDPLHALPDATSPATKENADNHHAHAHDDNEAHVVDHEVTLMPTPATACSTPKAFEAHLPSPADDLPSVAAADNATPAVIVLQELQPTRPLHALAYKTPAVAGRLRDATPASTASSGNISLTPGMQYVP